MRTLFAASAVLLLAAAPAVAAPAAVTVSIGPALQEKAQETYGVRELQYLADDLQRAVERQLTRTGAYDGARVELTITDAKPNRPTFKQMGDKPGLSVQSFGIGGAAVEGRIVAADGSVTPVGYKWYETDIRQAYGNGTWQDAQWTFQRLAHRLGRGDQLAAR